MLVVNALYLHIHYQLKTKQMKQDFLEKMERLFQKTAAVAGYIIAVMSFLMVIGFFCKGLLLVIE